MTTKTTIDIAEVEKLYSSLTTLVEKDLDKQFRKSRLKGTDFATVYAALMKEVISIAYKGATDGALIAAKVLETQSSVDLNKEKRKVTSKTT